MNFLSFLQNNLSHVLPVLIAGAFAIAIIIERAKALFVTFPMKDTKGFFERIHEKTLAGKTDEAIALCESQGDKPVAQIVRSALKRAHLPMEAVEQGVGLTLSELSGQVQKRTGYLATVANVATLMGLFGTIAGLIFSFEAVGHADPQQKSALLSAGIATAMNATMLGLAVAIPSMVAFAVLMGKSNKIVGEMEEAAARSVDVLKLRYYASDLVNESGTIESNADAGFKNGRTTTLDKGAANGLRRAA